MMSIEETKKLNPELQFLSCIGCKCGEKEEINSSKQDDDNYDRIICTSWPIINEKGERVGIIEEDPRRVGYLELEQSNDDEECSMFINIDNYMGKKSRKIPKISKNEQENYGINLTNGNYHVNIRLGNNPKIDIYCSHKGCFSIEINNKLLKFSYPTKRDDGKDVIVNACCRCSNSSLANDAIYEYTVSNKNYNRFVGILEHYSVKPYKKMPSYMEVTDGIERTLERTNIETVLRTHGKVMNAFRDFIAFFEKNAPSFVRNSLFKVFTNEVLRYNGLQAFMPFAAMNRIAPEELLFERMGLAGKWSNESSSWNIFNKENNNVGSLSYKNIRSNIYEDIYGYRTDLTGIYPGLVLERTGALVNRNMLRNNALEYDVYYGNEVSHLNLVLNDNPYFSIKQDDKSVLALNVEDNEICFSYLDDSENSKTEKIVKIKTDPKNGNKTSINIRANHFDNKGNPVAYDTLSLTQESLSTVVRESKSFVIGKDVMPGNEKVITYEDRLTSNSFELCIGSLNDNPDYYEECINEMESFKSKLNEKAPFIFDAIPLLQIFDNYIPKKGNQVQLTKIG